MKHKKMGILYFLEMESDKMGAEFSTKISALYIRIAKLFGLKGGW